MNTDKTFPEGFYWGEKRDGTLFARGCQLFWKNSDNLYSFYKKRKLSSHFRKTVPDISEAKRTELTTRCTVSVRNRHQSNYLKY